MLPHIFIFVLVPFSVADPPWTRAAPAAEAKGTPHEVDNLGKRTHKVTLHRDPNLCSHFLLLVILPALLLFCIQYMAVAVTTDVCLPSTRYHTHTQHQTLLVWCQHTISCSVYSPFSYCMDFRTFSVTLSSYQGTRNVFLLFLLLLLLLLLLLQFSLRA